EEDSTALSKKLDTLEQEISSVPQEIAEYRDCREKIQKFQTHLEQLSADTQKKEKTLEEHGSLLEKIDNFLESFNIDFFNDQKDNINEKQTRLQEILDGIVEFEKKQKTIAEKIDLLKAAPCSTSLKQRCHFVSDAKSAYNDNTRVRIELNQLKLNRDTVSKKIAELNPEKVTSYITKYYGVLDKKTSLDNTIASLKLEMQEDKLNVLKTESILKDLHEKQETFLENKKAIENLEVLLEKKAEVQNLKNISDRNLNNYRKEILDLYKSVGSLEQKHTQMKEQKEEFLFLEDEYTTADLFLRCMHPNGISYDIIKKRLPLINTEISKILTNIVDFEIFFENDESKLDISIKHPRHDPRPIEMGSGA
ncbi:MAG TPA: hypothetical protein DF712_17880, partial [Balneola sp.]|nr:hypothetical protein [Balneola sp.]